MAKAKKNDDKTAQKPSGTKPRASNKSVTAENPSGSVPQKPISKKSVDVSEGTQSPSPKASPTEKEAASQAATAKSQIPSKESSSSIAADATKSTDQAVNLLDGVALPASSGKAGVLGGPKDRGIKPEDKLALPVGRHFTFERIRSLNPKSFYCAMRWEYHLQGKSPEESKRWWANKKLLVANPTNGKRVIVRAVDFGPHENTGLTISLSPGALEALGLEIGGEVQIEFADQKAPLGVVAE